MTETSRNPADLLTDVTSSAARANPDDDHFHGWRLILVWTACVLFSWALLIGTVMALYEAIGFLRGLL